MRAILLLAVFAAACGDNLSPCPAGADGSCDLPSCAELCGSVAFCTADRTSCRCVPEGETETVACDGLAAGAAS